MTATLARIAAHLFNTPLLLVPETAVAIASNLSDRFGTEPVADAADQGVIEASRFRGTPAVRREDGRTFYRAENGVAVVPVLGELVNRGAWIGASSGLTSYEGLEAQLRAAATDPAVTGLLLDMNSPGGEATGCMEIGALVRSIAKDKPVVAFVNGMAASAGYAIAAGATKIVATPTAILGSIGVVMLHLDRSAALAKAGVKPTLIHAGAHKVDGSSLQSLAPEARDRIQASIDGLYDLFVAHVSTHRKLDAQAVRATEGGLLMGQAAVSAGLADRIGTFDDALALLKPKGQATKGFQMTDMTRAAHEDALRAQASQLTASLTDQHTKALAEATAKAGAEAIAADRARTAAILGHAEAKGREEQANHLAFATTMTADEAVATLAKAPKPAAAAGRQQRLVVPDPKLSADGGAEPSTAAEAETTWEVIAKDMNAGLRR